MCGYFHRWCVCRGTVSSKRKEIWWCGGGRQRFIPDTTQIVGTVADTPLRALQKQMVPSQLPETRRRPSGLKATALTAAVWPTIVHSSTPAGRRRGGNRLQPLNDGFRCGDRSLLSTGVIEGNWECLAYEFASHCVELFGSHSRLWWAVGVRGCG